MLITAILMGRDDLLLRGDDGLELLRAVRIIVQLLPVVHPHLFANITFHRLPSRIRVDRRRQDESTLEGAFAAFRLVQTEHHRLEQHGFTAARRTSHDHTKGDPRQHFVLRLSEMILARWRGLNNRH